MAPTDADLGRIGDQVLSFGSHDTQDHERQPLTQSVREDRRNVTYDAASSRDEADPPSSVASSVASSIRRRGTLSAASTLQSSRRSNYKISSLDFERVVNLHSIEALKKRFRLARVPSVRGLSKRPSLVVRLKRQRRRLLGYSGRTATRWVLTVVAGLTTGLAAISLVLITGSIVELRNRVMGGLLQNPHLSREVIFQRFLWTNVLLALASSLLCVAWVPAGAGSGIPEVKAYLNGVRSMQKLASLPLFFVKILGTILSVSSGLSVGQEGPLIHIGAIMGASCTKIGGTLDYLIVHWNAMRRKREKGHRRGTDGQRHHGEQERESPRQLSRMEQFLNWSMEELSHFATDAERRDLVSIGASVGFAASFGAPISGLLFILDDVSCYFKRSLLLRILVANAVGVFCLAIKRGDLTNYSVISMGNYDYVDAKGVFDNRLVEVPLYVLVGIGGGIIGGVFPVAYMWLRQHITSKFPPPGQGRAEWQLLEVAVVSVISSLALFYLPTVSWACKPIPDASRHDIQGFGGNVTAAMDAFRRKEELKRFFCGPGEVNEMASIVFGSRIVAIRDILTDPGQYKNRTLVSVGFLFYVLTLITFGTAIPAGLFTPFVLIGAALGGACGNVFQQYVDEQISPSTFALLGVAASLAGVQRSTVSAAVILVEGTGQIKGVCSLIIVVVVARYVAARIHSLGIFETVIEYKEYPYLWQEDLKRYYSAVEVKDIMNTNIETLGPKERVGDLVRLLDTSKHHGFPIIESDTGRFLGLVKRAQIAALLECGLFSKQQKIQGEKDLVAAAYGIRIDAYNKGDSAPLMHWAYHINDDRYDHILAIPEEENERESYRMASFNSRSLSIRNSTDDEEREEITNHPAQVLLTKGQRAVNNSIRMSLMRNQTGGSSSSWSSALSEVPQDFCTVTRNDAGNIVVSWYNAEFDQYWVDLASVANRGTYTVPEFCPVSKAYRLFTALGLRHIVVLGGHSGGKVVGILTRASFLDAHVEEEFLEHL
ncbi:hypothetical protein ACHAWF_012401 [Thalassiosira exigua]